MQYLDFEQARKFVRLLNLKGHDEWTSYCKGKMPKLPAKPHDIPATPSHVYKDNGWLGVGDWLGTGRTGTHNRRYCPFKKARAFVHTLNLKSSAEWKLYCKGEMPGLSSKPDDIPSGPDRTYQDKGWISWPDWVGTSHSDGDA